MKPEYTAWIKQHYPTKESALCACQGATEKMVEAFPELKRERGYAHMLGGSRTHWWCVTPDSVIIDPTAHQWGMPILEYEAYVVDEELGDPIGKCMNCGEICYEKVPGASSCCCCHECAGELNAEYNCEVSETASKFTQAELDEIDELLVRSDWPTSP